MPVPLTRCWLITKDLLAEPHKDTPLAGEPGTNLNAVGVYGPRGAPDVTKPELRAQLPFFFRMKDDDGEVYYEGLSGGMTFNPLDDFGMPNAGCTTIEYLTGRKWEAL